MTASVAYSMAQPVPQHTTSTHASCSARQAKVRRRKLHSHLLGDVMVSDASVLEFPDGLFGFSTCTTWVLVDAGRPGWMWLHALDHPALAFLLADPFDSFPGFSVELSAQDLAALDAQSATEVAVFAIATLPMTASDSITLNLQGPVAIALPARRGRQLVVSDARLGAKVAIESPFVTAAQVCGGPDDTQS
jgi:flagellar assembly factor FliW